MFEDKAEVLDNRAGQLLMEFHEEPNIIYNDDFGNEDYLLLAKELWSQLCYLDAERVLEAACDRHDNFKEARSLYDQIRADRSSLYKIVQIQASKRRFCLDSPGEQAFSKERLKDVHFSGWIQTFKDGAFLVVEEGGRTRSIAPISIERPSVLDHLRKSGLSEQRLGCGFSFRANVSDGLKVYYKTGSDTELVFTVHLNRVEQVLIGKDDWLFLCGDKNKSEKLFTGKIPVRPSDATKWSDYAQNTRRILKQGDMKFCMVISPSKEDVFPELHPHEPSSTSLLETVRSSIYLSGTAVSCPVNRLRKSSSSYFRTDTHWSDLGAWICVTDILEQLGISLSKTLAPEFNDLEIVGDLGSRIQPPQTSIQKVWIPQSDETRITFDNKVVGSGGIRIVANPNAAEKQSVLLFGGSSTGSLLRVLSDVFAKVIRINSPSTMPIMQIVEREKPDIVICQTSSRFLKTPARIAAKISDSSLAKLDRHQLPEAWLS